jgi:phosphate transport system protein
MSSIIPRGNFDRHLHRLLDQVLILGSMAEQAVQSALDALIRRDQAAARRIFDADQRINEKRYAIENECIGLIATQQPMARDVRLLTAILEIITELERIGDYAKGICRINLLLSEDPIDFVIIYDLQQMAKLGLSMLQRALDAFVNLDAAAARAIPHEDDNVDRLYNRIYLELINQMVSNAEIIDRANHLMWAAHNLERMADRVTNICERIIYVASGNMNELNFSRLDISGQEVSL